MPLSILPGPLVTLGMVHPSSLGLEFLGGAKAAGSVSELTVSFEAREAILIFNHVAGMSAASTVAVQFNGETGTRYHWRNFSSPSAAGLASFNNVDSGFTGTTRLLMHDTSDTTNLARTTILSVFNRSTVNHVCFWQDATAVGTASPATFPRPNLGVGEYIPASDNQITSCRVFADGGQTLNDGSNVLVFGRNYP